jgi:hypothetical protein
MHETDVLYLDPDSHRKDIAKRGANYKAALITGHHSLLLCLARHV